MALVAYSDSENSDSDTACPPQHVSVAKKQTPAVRNPLNSNPFQPLVDRGNPRKIHISLPNETPRDSDDGVDDGAPIRKRRRIVGGNAFSGFNALLPPPKRTGPVKRGSEKTDTSPALTRKVFTLKTSEVPGFDRDLDEEIIQHQTLRTGEESPAPANVGDIPPPFQSHVGDKKTGNAMMFKPLSVARNKTKKQLKAVSNRPELDASGNTSPRTEPAVVKPTPVSELKPKVSLFGLSREEKPVKPHEAAAGYKPLLYNAADSRMNAESHPPTGLARDASPLASPSPDMASSGTEAQTLTSIASDLNLSRSEMRQLLGRQSAYSSSDPSRASPKILTFSTDEEYRSNAEYLSSTTENEKAALQHNPVRSIAPGKHSLQQLVNAVTNQRDALEESFAVGRRNKKEAGSKYGW